MTGIFSIAVGVLTIIFPFGLEAFGEAAGIVYTAIVLISTILLLIFSIK